MQVFVQFRSLPHLLQLLHLNTRSPDRKGVIDIANRDPESVDRKKHPEHVEEKQVHPEVHPVASIKVVVGGQPLGAEGNETPIQLHGGDDNHDDVSPGRLAGETVAYHARHGSRDEDGEELQADDDQVGAGPATVGFGVHHPQLGRGAVAAGLGPVDASDLAQIIVRCWGQRHRVGYAGQGDP